MIFNRIWFIITIWTLCTFRVLNSHQWSLVTRLFYIPASDLYTINVHSLRNFLMILFNVLFANWYSCFISCLLFCFSALLTFVPPFTGVIYVVLWAHHIHTTRKCSKTGEDCYVLLYHPVLVLFMLSYGRTVFTPLGNVPKQVTIVMYFSTTLYCAIFTLLTRSKTGWGLIYMIYFCTDL